MIMNKIKANKYIIGGFLLPLVVMTFIMMVMQITPFGQYSLLVSDLDAQYIDRITGFRKIMLEGKSIFYTWSQIQGSTPYGFIEFVPSNLLYLLVSEEYLLDMLTWVTIFKIALAGASFAFYIKKTFYRNDISISIFSWCYALMGYGISYHFLLGWEEQIIMLPIVLYGVEKILKDKKDYLLFTISLAITFIMSYLIAYMTGIFAFLYFIYRYLTINKKYDIKDMVQKSISFFISPILALGCTCILIVPVMSLMAQRDGLFDSSNLKIYLRYEFEGLFSKLFVGSYDTILPGGLPYIYCGIIVLILIGFYFSSYIITYKEKMISFCLLAFMFLSLTLNPLYVAWHGFKPPVYFEARFSYLVSFLMIFIAYKGFCTIKTISMKQIHIVFLVLTGAFLLFNRQDYTFVNDESILYSLAFIGLYYLLLMLLNKTNYEKKKIMLLLALFVGLELASNVSVTMNGLDKELKYPLKNQYTDAYNKMKSITTHIQNEDKDFYRIEFVEKRGMNDGFGVGFSSITHFDSVYNYEVKESIGQLGIASGHNWIEYIGSTPIVDTLLNIKYVVSEKEKYFGYPIATERDGAKIYKNPYAVSVGFMVEDDLHDLSSTEPLTRQEEILNRMLGAKANYYIPLKIEKITENNVGIVEEEKQREEVQYKILHYYVQDKYQFGSLIYEIQMTQDGPCFMSMKSDDYYSFNINVSDKLISQNCTDSQKSIYLGDYTKGEKLKIELQLAEEYLDIEEVAFYQMNDEQVKEAFEELNQSALQISKYTDTLVVGNIEVGTDRQILYTSIPYDKGWKMYVDGKQVESQKVMNAFLGIQLEEGKHEIRLEYIPSGFVKGVVISILSWIIVILIVIKHYQDNKKKK